MHLYRDAKRVKQAVNFPVTLREHSSLIDMLSALSLSLSLSSPPQQVLLSLFLHIHSPAPSLSQLNNKKLFSLACYLTAVLWIDGCVHAHAWQLLCTPNEFNHRAPCQHVISSLCLLGERWNCSGLERREGGEKEGWRERQKGERGVEGGERAGGGGGEGQKNEDVWREKEKGGNRGKEVRRKMKE